MWPPLYFPLPSDLTHVTAPSLLGHSSAFHLISVRSPGKPAFYNYYRAGSAATDLGRKRSGARSHTRSCSEWEF